MCTNLWIHLIEAIWCDNICNWTNSVYVLLHVARIPMCVAKRCIVVYFSKWWPNDRRVVSIIIIITQSHCTLTQDVRRNEEKEEIEKRVQQMSKMYFACIKSSFVIINNCYFAAIPIRVIFISELQMHAFVVYDMRMHKSVSHWLQMPSKSIENISHSDSTYK